MFKKLKCYYYQKVLRMRIWLPCYFKSSGYLQAFKRNFVREERLCLERDKRKGIKVTIRSLDGPRLKTQTQELQKTSFEVSVVWKHPALKAVQCKLRVWFCGQISAVYFYTQLNMNAHALVNLLANAFQKHLQLFPHMSPCRKNFQTQIPVSEKQLWLSEFETRKCLNNWHLLASDSSQTAPSTALGTNVLYFIYSYQLTGDFLHNSATALSFDIGFASDKGKDPNYTASRINLHFTLPLTSVTVSCTEQYQTRYGYSFSIYE